MKIRIRHVAPFAEYEVQPGVWRQVETVEVVTARSGLRSCGNTDELRQALAALLEEFPSAESSPGRRLDPLERAERMNGYLCQMVGYGTQALRGAIANLEAGAGKIALEDLERDLAEMERRWCAREDS